MRPDVAAYYTADVFKFHRLVDEKFRRESEAFFLPILALVNSGSNDLFDQVLRIRPVDRVSVFHSSICHCSIFQKENNNCGGDSKVARSQNRNEDQYITMKSI